MRDRCGRGTDRSGVALVTVALLFLVLSIFASAAVAYLVGSLTAELESRRRTAVFYVAEAARAHATARVKAGVSSQVSETIALTDDGGTTVGEYSYVITDVTLPEQPPRRRVRVSAYSPTEAAPSAQYHAVFYLEDNGSVWTLVSYRAGS